MFILKAPGGKQPRSHLPLHYVICNCSYQLHNSRNRRTPPPNHSNISFEQFFFQSPSSLPIRQTAPPVVGLIIVCAQINQVHKNKMGQSVGRCILSVVAPMLLLGTGCTASGDQQDRCQTSCSLLNPCPEGMVCATRTCSVLHSTWGFRGECLRAQGTQCYKNEAPQVSGKVSQECYYGICQELRGRLTCDFSRK